MERRGTRVIKQSKQKKKKEKSSRPFSVPTGHQDAPARVAHLNWLRFILQRTCTVLSMSSQSGDSSALEKQEPLPQIHFPYNYYFIAQEENQQGAPPFISELAN